MSEKTLSDTCGTSPLESAAGEGSIRNVHEGVHQWGRCGTSPRQLVNDVDSDTTQNVLRHKVELMHFGVGLCSQWVHQCMTLPPSVSLWPKNGISFIWRTFPSRALLETVMKNGAPYESENISSLFIMVILHFSYSGSYRYVLIAGHSHKCEFRHR